MVHQIGVRRRGFSLIELIVVLAIIGLALLVVMPRLGGPDENETRDFVGKLNALMQTAWQSAILSHTVHRVKFDLNGKTVSVDELSTMGARPSDDKFKPLKMKYVATSVAIPADIAFKNFFIDGKDELAGDKKRDVWLYVMPDGSAQAIVANFVRTSDSDAGDEPVGLVLNPLNAQFAVYATFQRP